MTNDNRRRIILDRLERHGACSYQELAQWLGVSNMTVWRDVDRLAREGVLIKTLGGVQKINAPSTFYESEVLSRLSTNKEEKQAIAFCALETIRPPQTIFIDGSTTCLELAKLLALKCKGLTVVTHSALACLELGRSGDNRIIGIGGQYDPASLCFVGPTSEDEARKFFVDQAFLSTKGFLPAEGTYESTVATFRIKQIVTEQAAAVSLLVDHSKFGKRALCKVLDIAKIHTVITDGKTSKDDIGALRCMHKTVRVAGCPEVPENIALATVT